jgi:uncharacterized protein YqgC (DUF456 family)
MAVTDLLVGLAVLVGLVGIVVPVMPGSVLILAAVVVWAAVAGSPSGWLACGLAAALLVVGGVVKFVVPGRRLRAGGVPNRTLVAGGLLGIVGFFVIPVVGLLVGFVAGVYLSEVQRVGRARAWPSTSAALRAAGLSLLIELAAGLLATLVWLVGALTV